jgi:hypothetical protein
MAKIWPKLNTLLEDANKMQQKWANDILGKEAKATKLDKKLYDK